MVLPQCRAGTRRSASHANILSPCSSHGLPQRTCEVPLLIYVCAGGVVKADHSNDAPDGEETSRQPNNRGQFLINDDKQTCLLQVHFLLFPAAPAVPLICRNHSLWFAAPQKHPLKGRGRVRKRSVKAERDSGISAGSQYSHGAPTEPRNQALSVLPETLRSC